MASFHFNCIQSLCENEDDFPESFFLEQLNSILSKDPTVSHERDSNGYTLLHYAARYRSVEFCKCLVVSNPEAVAVQTNRMGTLPFHISCHKNNAETAKYLFQLHPESIDMPDNKLHYPIHYLLSNHSNYTIYGEKTSLFKLTQFLLKHDRGAVTKPDNDGWLPLHHACRFHDLDIVKAIFDAYPEAIHIRNFDGPNGGPPFLLATRNNCDDGIRPYLYTQLQFISLAEEEKVPDGDGQLPIHAALQEKDISLGAVKLMLKANPGSICAADNQGRIPLHIACQFGEIEIVKHLLDADKGSLKTCDLRGNCALHHACLAGNFNIIHFILDQPDHGVSLNNKDGQLPTQLLLFQTNCDRDSFQFMNAIYALLRAYPAIYEIFVERWLYYYGIGNQLEALDIASYL